MKNGLLLFFVLTSLVSAAQSGEEDQIKKLLLTQTESWNRGDLEGFMQTYWKSDSLMFIGKNGVKWGWQETLDNYKRGYPDTAAMGKLSFHILVVKKLSPDYYYVVGKWMLKRTIGDLSGHYNLLLRKIKGQWMIVADHSS
ncbi:MAG TPA: nuclear transport factor 2 family protein [Flavisolibacter sp.]